MKLPAPWLRILPALAFASAAVLASPPQQQLSAAEIEAMFETPTAAVQLLRNLKIAVDRGLLTQPAFVDEATLAKVFNGHVISREPVADAGGPYFNMMETLVGAAGEYFPAVTIRVRQGFLGHFDARGQLEPPKGDAQRFGMVTMDVGSVRELTVCSVRDVFGAEGTMQWDSGNTPHGGTYAPTMKGDLIYDFGDGVAPGRSGPTEVKFEVKLENSGVPVQWPAYRKRPPIHNIDEVQHLTIYQPGPRAAAVSIRPVADDARDVVRTEQHQLLRAGGIAALFLRPDSVMQLLLNIDAAVRRNVLLQPSFYEDEVLQRLFNGSPPIWRQKSRRERGRAVLKREGRIQVDTAGLPRMRVLVRERITAPDSLVSGSMTVEVQSGPAICVCELRDALGPETRLRVSAGQGSVVYDYSNEAHDSVDTGRKGAVFLIHKEDSAEMTSIHGRDQVREFTVTEGQP